MVLEMLCDGAGWADVGHVELLPLAVGLGPLAASLPALLVMCQAWKS